MDAARAPLQPAGASSILEREAGRSACTTDVELEQEEIRARFDAYLRKRKLKLTAQRQQILDFVFSTHDHFTAEGLLRWMQDGAGGSGGAQVSRATVYRTLGLLVEGGFIGSIENGRGEVMYEHLLGHEHHDHIHCTECGRIVEFHNEEIERLQERVAREHGFVLTNHSLRLEGLCSSCSEG